MLINFSGLLHFEEHLYVLLYMGVGGRTNNGMNLVTCASKLKVVRGIPGQLF